MLDHTGSHPPYDQSLLFLSSISISGRHLELHLTHNHCAKHSHFQDTLTGSNLGQEERCSSSEIHGGEGTAAGALAVLEEADCTACYITQIRKQRQIGNRVRLTPPEMDFFQLGFTSQSFHISQNRKTIWEPLLGYMRMWVTFYIWATAPGIWGLLFGHLQLVFLFLSGPCCANIKPQIPLVWWLSGDSHFLRMNVTVRTNPGPSNSHWNKILEPHTPRTTSHFIHWHLSTGQSWRQQAVPIATTALTEGQSCMWENRNRAPLVFSMTCTVQVFALFSHENVLEKAKIYTFQTWSHQYARALAKVPQDVMRTEAQSLDRHTTL